jgi:hypothetical protein
MLKRDLDADIWADVRENARRQLREMATALNDLADAVGDLGPMAESTLLVEAEKVIALAGQLARICRGTNSAQPASASGATSTPSA